MVGMVSRSPREKVSNLIYSTKFGIEIPPKLENLNNLNKDWFRNDPVLISEFLPNLLDLQSDRFSPVRKLVTQIIGEIGLRHVEIIPEIVPVLLSTIVQEDELPAVSRQAITCGIHLFQFTLEKVALQGLYSSELDESVETSWASMLKFKEKMYAIAFQAGGSDSIRLPAIKFVEAVILLYTPDPNGTLEPPPPLAFEGSSRVEFNISWLRGGHPLLKVGDLSVEASQSLGFLLDQLRFPAVKSLSRSIIILLVNSLAATAKKRPGFYGRILPVLLALDPSNSISNEVHVYATRYCLKKAFLSCLECTHPSAMPWRERLLGALKELQSGGVVKQAISKINGSLGERKVDPMLKDSDPEYLQEEKPSINSLVTVQNIVGKKRPVVPDISDAGEDGDVSGKRVRASPDGSSKESKKDPAFVWDDNSSIKLQNSKSNIDSEPVQQLVAMFGALVAQGEKAVGSLEILIASISADLLTEVVMATMRNLPSNLPKSEGAEDLLQDGGIIGGSTQVKHSLTLLADVFSRSGAFPQISSSACAQQSVSSVTEKNQDKECLVASTSESDHETETASLQTQSQVSSDGQSEMEKSAPAFTSDLQDVGDMESEIPGLESLPRPYVKQETLDPSSLAPPDFEDAIQDHATSLGRRSPANLLPTMSIDRSEDVSSKSAVADANNITATSVVLKLPEMTAPVVNLNDEQKDNLQLITFTRIIEAYKQIAVAGGSHIRVSVLAYLAVQFPLELDPWKILQKHILSDYTTHEGQEFTLRVLYRLFGEAEEHDFFSSTAAKSVYDMFLLTVAETLRDSFPASDKSLSKLLGEVPYLPKSVFILLEHLCCPENSAKDEKELQSGDRVTQGLSAIWNLILLRPPIREACLNIALQSAAHHLEEVRMKAIRLVANKLYPISSIALQIEDFAKKLLLSVVNGVLTADKTEVDGTSLESEKVMFKESNLEKPSNEHPSAGAISNDPSDTDNSSMSESLSPISEAQRCMSLYFALCTKKHSLFRQIFTLYKSTSKAVKQAIHRHIPILVRTMGSSMDLLDIISDPPPGSEDLLMQVLSTLTDGIIPSPELIFAIRKSYDSKLKNAEILIPILPFLPRDEVLMIFPHLVTLPLDKFQAALIRVLQSSSPSGEILTPAEVLIAIHGIDPDRDGIPLKKVTDACNACFELRQTFTHQVLAKVLNQLVEQIPLPLLFMRTVLQAIGAFPALVGFIMEILSRLVSKQIWKYPKQWVGFLKCAQLTKPQSFSVLLQLPPAQLENALNRVTPLKAPLIAHANQPNIRSTLPRSVLVVLGIGTDSHHQPKTINQQQQQEEAQQTSEAQTEEDTTTTTTVISDKEEAIGELTKESSSSAS